MDQSDADWCDWSLNNDGAVNQQLDIPVEVKQEPVDDEQRLTAYDEEPPKEQGDFHMYDDDSAAVSGSAESDGSELEDNDEGGELQKGILGKGERGPLGQLQPQSGMVMCEFCGQLGVRDAFYSKTKRFCSVSCSKSFACAQKDGKPTPFSLLQASLAQAKPKGSHGYLKSQYVGAGGVKFGSGSSRAFDWSSYINQTNAIAAPVSCFKHCIMSESWDNIAVGMKVEVINTDCQLQNEAYWIATVVQLAGYRALLRYEGFGNDSSMDFWLNLCTKDVHPVGWCATHGKPLVPPKTIINKYIDWKDFLVKRLTGSRTLPQNFHTRLQESFQNTPVKKGMFVEVVDKMCVSAMRVARVEEVIGGRLKLHYVDSKVENDEFWCHQQSPLVHPVGWSQLVGHKLHASQEYKTESLNKAALRKYTEFDSTPDMFPKTKDLPPGARFQVGMKLEAIDPLNLSSICVATVNKVLRNNYLMIGIDGSAAENGSDWFCYHATSPCIFPVGFCEINHLEITPPRGHNKGQFKWIDYLRQTKSSAAPVKLFDKDIPRHGFKVGMKIEAVDLMEPRLICVATIKSIVGRLLRVHFDGWESTYDQWVDCHSVDIYPVGWCEMVGYHLEGPRPKDLSKPQMLSVPKKRKSKSQIYRGPRKKRKHQRGATLLGGRQNSRNVHQLSLDSDMSQDSFTTVTSDSYPVSSSNSATVQKTVNTSGTDDVKTAVEGSDTLPPKSVQPDQRGIGSASSLVSSVPSIAQMLNSPIHQQGIHVLSPSASTSSSTVTATISASPPHHLLVTGVQTLSSPSSSSPPNAGSLHVLMNYVPRVIPGEPDKDCVVPVLEQKLIAPDSWDVQDVCRFLKINDCGAYCDSFRKKNIDGPQFLALTKEQIVNLTGMKVGPSLKIYDIIQALKQKVLQQSSVQEEATSKSQLSTTQMTASSGLIKQQGLMQQAPSEKAVSQGSQLLTQHLLKGTAVVQPTRTLQAQPTQ